MQRFARAVIVTAITVITSSSFAQTGSYRDQNEACVNNCSIAGTAGTLGCAVITAYTRCSQWMGAAAVGAMAACMEACPPVSGPVEVCQTNTASPESPFTAIYFQNDPGSGIGGFALNYTKDAMFPFDFDGDGKDDLFLYRAGRGSVAVLKSNGDGSFTTAYSPARPGERHRRLCFDSELDRAFPFDFDGDSKHDLFLYRAGRGSVACSNPTVTARSRLHFQPDLERGIGGYALDSELDRAFPFDFDGDGKDDLFLYRARRGSVAVQPTVTARSRLRTPSPTRGAASVVMLLIAN